jgi:hypothetical protein
MLLLLHLAAFYNVDFGGSYHPQDQPSTLKQKELETL